MQKQKKVRKAEQLGIGERGLLIFNCIYSLESNS